MKDKREGARGRHRAWRKVLLDGLDLLLELIQTAAGAQLEDTELAQDCQVRHLLHSLSTTNFSFHGVGKILLFTGPAVTLWTVHVHSTACMSVTSPFNTTEESRMYVQDCKIALDVTKGNMRCQDLFHAVRLRLTWAGKT